MGIKSLLGFGQARDKPVRNYSNGEYSFNFGRSTSGKSVNEMTAMQTTAVYACVRILSEAIASLPIHVYRYKDGGKERVCDHPLYTLISKRIWECVQLEIKRRKKYLEEHGTNAYSHRPESNPFASKIICGDCNKVFARKGWRSSTGVDRKVWQCSERYKVKGVMGCANRHVEEETLIKAYLMAWNALVENREDFVGQWTEQLQSENLLEGYRAEKFIEYTDEAEPLTEMDTDFMLKTLDHIKVFEDGTLLVVFLDGTEIECKNEEE